MAIMIPKTPREITPNSYEDVMFHSLEQLPNDYYIIHSYRTLECKDNQLRESETDFVIYNREKGVLVLEAKAVHSIVYKEGEWFYANGDTMKHDGPYHQASANMHRLRDDIIGKSGMKDLLGRCKFLYGVWFPLISKASFIGAGLPSEASIANTMTQESLDNPLPAIERLFSLNTYYGGHTITKTELSDIEDRYLLRDVICPDFNIFPSATSENNLSKIVFNRLLKEQALVLRFTTEQKSATISGAAGTGKTVIAVEKARREAVKGTRVLFLCFNVMLRDYLSEKFPYDGVDYYTIAKYACEVCHTMTPDYCKLKDKLYSMYYDSTFPYTHIVVDEGQDFGQEDIDEVDVLDTLKEIVSEKGSFFVFYDKLQHIQGKAIPGFIENTDCRLTLYQNCRNTENIAVTSLRPIISRKPLLHPAAIKGKSAKMHYCSGIDALAELDAILKDYEADGIKNPVILTYKTEADSLFKSNIQNGLYKGKYKFTTCRKFKGLESDGIILVDVDRDSFYGDNILRFYVGCSRAQLRLEIIADLSNEECLSVIQNDLNKEPLKKNSRQELASILNCLCKVVSAE